MLPWRTHDALGLAQRIKRWTRIPVSEKLAVQGGGTNQRKLEMLV